MERPPLSYIPEQNRDEAAEYNDQIYQYLENQLSRAQGPHRSESADELMEMIAPFQKNARVLEHLANIAVAHGERDRIFLEMFLAESEMADDPYIRQRNKTEREQKEAARARAKGLFAQWPILDTQRKPIRPEEYVGWLKDGGAKQERLAA